MVKLQIEGNFAGKKKLYSGLSFCNGGEIERREHMNGYYTKNLYGDNGTNAKGRLKIEASNLPEFKELLEKVEKEARQLNETISRLRNFEFNIDFSIAESTSES